MTKAIESVALVDNSTSASSGASASASGSSSVGAGAGARSIGVSCINIGAGLAHPLLMQSMKQCRATLLKALQLPTEEGRDAAAEGSGTTAAGDAEGVPVVWVIPPGRVLEVRSEVDHSQVFQLLEVRRQP